MNSDALFLAVILFGTFFVTSGIFFFTHQSNAQCREKCEQAADEACVNEKSSLEVSYCVERFYKRCKRRNGCYAGAHEER